MHKNKYKVHILFKGERCQLPFILILGWTNSLKQGLVSLHITGSIWGTTSLHHRISGIFLFRAMIFRHVRTDYSYYKINKRQSYFVSSGSRSSYKHWIQENVPISCLGNWDSKLFSHLLTIYFIVRYIRLADSLLLTSAGDVAAQQWKAAVLRVSADIKWQIWRMQQDFLQQDFFDISRSLCALVGLVIKKMRD